MKAWAIFYDDGSRFTDQDGSHWDAPTLGVVVIACAGIDRGDSVDDQILHGWDWYQFRVDVGQWWGHKLEGMLDQITGPDRQHCEAWLHGRMVSSRRFREICEDAERWLKARGGDA